MLDRPDFDDDAKPTDGQMTRAAVRRFVVDCQGRVLHGRVLHADGGDDDGGATTHPPTQPRELFELAPQLDPATFAALRKVVESAADGQLRLDLAGPGGPIGFSLRRTDDAGRYLAQLHDAGDGADSRERLEQRLAFEHMIAALSTELINVPAERLDALIEQALAQIGELFDVDRAYLFRFSADRSTQSNTHEWVAPGISREADNLQDIPLQHFPWLMPQLLADRAIHVPQVAALPDSAAIERAEFERENILSLVLVPFGGAAGTEGFIGFDSVRRERSWSAEILLGLRLVSQVFVNAFRAQDMSERLVELAFHDPLTGLANRRLLGERLSHALLRNRRDEALLAVIVIDLDDFKLVNDSYGHALGDRLLQIAASRISGVLRATDLVARLGGDEFVVVAVIDELASLSQLVERLLEAMREPVELCGVTVVVQLSVGIALHPDDGDDAETLLRQADAAMYSAKAEGKNRFAFFTEQMTRDSRAALHLRHDLRLAIQRDEIRPHYQPRVALPSMRVLGFEALARWSHPRRGLLLPQEFLGLAGSSGVIGRIDMCILACALEDLAGWRRLDPDCRVSVNLDATDLQDQHLLAHLQDVLAGLGAGAGNLELEITESSLMRDIAAATRALSALREAAPGLQIAIDDFGSGYSSLACLGRLPVTTLKIDRGFVAGLALPDDRGGRALIKSIIDLGRNLGLHVMAEGVETRAQADALCELGCAEGQGFLFSPAVPAEAAAALLAGRR